MWSSFVKREPDQSESGVIRNWRCCRSFVAEAVLGRVRNIVGFQPNPCVHIAVRVRVSHHFNSSIKSLCHNMKTIWRFVSSDFDGGTWDSKRKLRACVFNFIGSDVNWTIVGNLAHQWRKDHNSCSINVIRHGIDPANGHTVPSRTLVQLRFETPILAVCKPEETRLLRVRWVSVVSLNCMGVAPECTISVTTTKIMVCLVVFFWQQPEGVEDFHLLQMPDLKFLRQVLWHMLQR